MRSEGVGVGFSVMAKAMAQQGLGLQVLVDTLAGLEEDQVTSSPTAVAPFRKTVEAAAGIGNNIDTVV